MKPKILVLYFTQTGQLQHLLESIVCGMGGHADVEAVAIEPVEAYPFPWATRSYFDLLPDSMAHTPVALQPLTIPPADYDLVILGYQPWFLNPSIPIISFLNSEYAQALSNKPVVTVIGCRKMWLHAQERVKERLAALNSRLVGNIIFDDGVPAPISSLTSARWLFKGKKEATGFLPCGGVAAGEIYGAQRFGASIYKHLEENNLIDLHRELLALGAVKLSSAAIVAEQRMLKSLRLGAQYIQGKNGAARDKRVDRVKTLLLAGYVMWPFFLAATLLKMLLQTPALLKDREYFRHLQYEKGRI